MTPANAPNAHHWSAAIDLNASPEQASHAAAGQAVMIDPGVKVDCHMVRCRFCHETYDECHDQPCPGRPRRRLKL